jgi:hypothetical protein
MQAFTHTTYRRIGLSSVWVYLEAACDCQPMTPRLRRVARCTCNQLPEAAGTNACKQIISLFDDLSNLRGAHRPAGAAAT